MKFGILGEAKIAREHIVPAILAAGHEVTHVGRRSPGQIPLPSVYKDAIETDYDSLLSDSSIDAIYNPLPNHLHVPYSINGIGLKNLILENISLPILFLAILSSLKVTSVIVKLMVVALYMTLVVTLYCQAVYFLKVTLKSSQQPQ